MFLALSKGRLYGFAPPIRGLWRAPRDSQIHCRRFRRAKFVPSSEVGRKLRMFPRGDFKSFSRPAFSAKARGKGSPLCEASFCPFRAKKSPCAIFWNGSVRCSALRQSAAITEERCVPIFEAVITQYGFIIRTMATFCQVAWKLHEKRDLQGAQNTVPPGNRTKKASDRSPCVRLPQKSQPFSRSSPQMRYQY